MLNKIKIENFKSIRKVDLELKNINILIGANGAGKSNFIQFLELLHSIGAYNLQYYVAKKGGANDLLHFGRKHSDSIKGEFEFDKNAYKMELTAADKDVFFIKYEGFDVDKGRNSEYLFYESIGGSWETTAYEEYGDGKENYFTVLELKDLRVYHFHDTSSNAPVKMASNIDDNKFFRQDASNLAAFLYRLQEKHKEHFKKIENTIRLIAPFFKRFQLEPSRLNEEKIKLEWEHVNSDEYFNANHLSDGTLRMICLITLFLQPEPYKTIIIDEPELGLHPAAIELLAALIRSAAAQERQVICSTQSVTLLNKFEPEDIIVVDRANGESHFRRLVSSELKEWLDEYAIGDLWEKNLLGGRP